MEPPVDIARAYAEKGYLCPVPGSIAHFSLPGHASEDAVLAYVFKRFLCERE